MAFTLLQGNATVGISTPQDGAAPTLGTFAAVTTAATFVGTVIRAPRDGTLHSFEFMMSTAAQVPTNGLTLSFQGIDVNGNPDNTDDEFRVVAAGSIGASTWIIPPGPITSDGTDTGTKRTVVASEPIACVMKFTSFVAGDSIAPMSIIGSNAGQPWHRSTNSGGTWSRVGTALSMILRYTDGYEFIHPYIFPVTSVTTQAFDSGTTPDEVGMSFTLPYDFEFAGIELPMVCVSATQVNTVRLYSHDDTILDSTTYYHGQFASANTFANVFIPFDRFSPCTANAVHRVTIRPSSTNDVTLYNYNVPSQDYLNAFGGGITHFHTQRTDDGAWTDTEEKRPVMKLYISRLDAVVGGDRGGSYGWVG
jgi:hypothetical protein